MKRTLGIAGLAAIAVGLISTATPASATGVIIKPADCTVTSSAVFSVVIYNMTCSARAATEQWQIVVWCNPRGADGADFEDYGNIVTGNNGTSTGKCQFNSPAGYADVTFNNSNLQTPGRHQ